jgi:serine/threonine-protein kinase
MAQADAWSLSAERRATDDGAFTNKEIGETDKHDGEISTLFGPPGPQATKALIAAAMGDWATQANACAEFVMLGSKPSENLDATLGLSGILLSGAMLMSPSGVSTDTTAVVNELGNRVLAALWESIDVHPPIGERGPVKFLGIAHGWAGFLYATLQWCNAAGTDLPTNMSTRLLELAACAEPFGLGLRWPSERYLGQKPSTRNYMSGWCHGTAGYSILWNLAYRILKDQEFSLLAHRAAIYTWEDPDGYPSLCCGLAGRGYALLDHYRSSGDSTWIDRAAILVDRAVDGRSRIPTNMRHSLYKGELGIATLISDLTRPESARFPFFQPLF